MLLTPTYLPPTPTPNTSPTDPAPAPEAPAPSQPGAPAPAPGAPPTGGEDPAAPPAQSPADKLVSMSAADALGAVDASLAKLATMTVGGGTPEGTANAKAATGLLTDASIMLQQAHIKALEQLQQLAADLNVQMMSSAAGLAFAGGQVAAAGDSKTPVKLAEVAGGQLAQAAEALQQVAAALAPVTPAPGAPAPGGGGETTPAPGAPAPAPAPAPGGETAPAAEPTPAPEAEGGSTSSRPG